MTPRDLLARLESEGITAELKLTLKGSRKPSAELEQLATRHRDDLVTYLAMSHGDTPKMCRLSEQRIVGAMWCRRCYRYQLRTCIASDKAFEDVK